MVLYLFKYDRVDKAKVAKMIERDNKLALFLKEKRTAAGLSQEEVATKLGYSTSQFISNWERGISQPPINTLKFLAKLYNVNPEEMFQVLLQNTIAIVEQDLKNKFYRVSAEL